MHEYLSGYKVHCHTALPLGGHSGVLVTCTEMTFLWHTKDVSLSSVSRG